MEKTKIDWCDSSWNPVTGCLHECEYCYARGIAHRFGFHASEPDINERVLYECPVSAGKKVPYPFDFQPTFHRYRLNDYIGKQGRNIFVCSMADLFGDWVPMWWRNEVFKACRKGPQHNYLFLTKNPGMYAVMDEHWELPTDSNMWFGTSVTTPDDPFPHNSREKRNLFLSIEPLLADFGAGSNAALRYIGWVIIGAETGNRKGQVVPEKSWVDNIVEQCRALNIPVFMKESLRALYGDNLLREFPQGLIRG